MTDFECYQLFYSVKFHFTKPKYSYFEYEGRTSHKEETYNYRTDQYLFYSLNNKHPKRGDLVYFLVSNFIVNPDLWVIDMLSSEAENNYSKFKGTLQSLSYIFDTECRVIFEDWKDALSVDARGNHPRLFRGYLQNEVHLETMCILNKILNFIPKWNKKINDDIIWPAYKMKIEKYTEFLKLEYDRYSKILQKHL